MDVSSSSKPVLTGFAFLLPLSLGIGSSSHSSGISCHSSSCVPRSRALILVPKGLGGDLLLGAAPRLGLALRAAWRFNSASSLACAFSLSFACALAALALRPEGVGGSSFALVDAVLAFVRARLAAGLEMDSSFAGCGARFRLAAVFLGGLGGSR